MDYKLQKVDIESKLCPELQESFKAFPSRPKLTSDQLVMFQEQNQVAMGMMQSETSDKIVISEVKITNDHGNSLMSLRIFKPADMKGVLPGLLWLHGGGYIVGMPSMDDGLCERFVLEAGCVVVAPDYRLAPQHPYPAAINDCFESLEWMKANANSLGIDGSNIAVGGASAGGGLTAALALMTRDKKGPEISFLMPLYPMINDKCDTVSNQTIDHPKVWSKEINELAWGAYLGDLNSNEVPVYAAAARETNYNGLPPVYTCVGELDPFRDETIEYISNLTKAGVPTEFQLYPGCFHGFDMLVPNSEIALRAKNNFVNALKVGLNR